MGPHDRRRPSWRGEHRGTGSTDPGLTVAAASGERRSRPWQSRHSTLFAAASRRSALLRKHSPRKKVYCR
ncbi:hypothetical protein PUN28_018513 [Cardiocondyla obscurior]|uniref:Histone H3 n=1 Tax=Cardiocondyla obscurior TaxID=286306 RepID=A0AAW2EIL3_9HYME